MTLRTRPSLACALAALAATPLATHAQDVSRVVAATIYTDGAVVERQLKTPGGTRHVEIACMPPGFDVSTLQVDGDPSVRLGDLRTEPVTGDEALTCARGPLDARIRALQDRKAALDAQSRADDIALDYLRRWNGGGAEPAAAHAPSAAARPGAAADSLRQSALELMTDQGRLKQQATDVDHQLATLQKSVRRVVHPGNWTTLRLDISTAAAATLRVRYHVPDARWQLGYRVALDSAKSTLHIDRQAEISQGSGEDWSDVALTLSMDRNQTDGGWGMAESWAIDLRHGMPMGSITASSITGGQPLQRDKAQRVEITGASMRYPGIARATRPGDAADAPALDHTPVLGMQADERVWDTLFHASQRVSMPSDNETHTLALDTFDLPVQLSLETQPQQDPNVYLIATAPRPAGLWPRGNVQLWRDGALVDKFEDVSLIGDDRLELSFGRDERIAIAVERPKAMRGSEGFFGSQTRLGWGTVFVITNRHPTAQKVHVVDASPVSRDTELKVETKLDPAPTETEWRHKPGVNAWTFDLAPNQTQRLSVSQTLTFPKDSTVTNLPDIR